MATDYGKSPSDYLIPNAPRHLKYWFDQAAWIQADDIQLARREAAQTSPPSTGATGEAGAGEVSFFGRGRWEDADDDADDIAEDLRRYPIGGPVQSVVHHLAQ
jgi:hypothetical protein